MIDLIVLAICEENNNNNNRNIALKETEKKNASTKT